MLRYGVRVGFEGDLRVACHIEGTADSGKDGGHALGAEEGGGAAAEVDGIDPVIGGQGAALLDVGADGGEVILHQLVVLGGQGVKVAVHTFAAAEGYMDINAQRGFVLSDQ